jgi:hypothetical protein
MRYCSWRAHLPPSSSAPQAPRLILFGAGLGHRRFQFLVFQVSHMQGPMEPNPSPAWDQMTLEEKFAFLCERAESLATDKRSLQIDIHSLLGKCLALDSKISKVELSLRL